MKKSLIALAFGTLGLGIAEFTMMGILPYVAADLNIGIPVAGHFISAYALGVCAGAPMLILARKRPLKHILLALMALMLIGNLGAAMATGYWSLLAARFISGLPHGAYFGVASIVAGKLADEGRSSEAVSIMIAGMTVANLFGVPLGTSLSHILSWRVTFLLVACWGVIVLYYIWRWVPAVEGLKDTGFKGQFRFLKTPAPWLILGATALGNGGVFCWYSYITPLLTNVSGFSAGSVTALMMLAGFGMVVGNLVSGRLSDRYTPGRLWHGGGQSGERTAFRQIHSGQGGHGGARHDLHCAAADIFPFAPSVVFRHIDGALYGGLVCGVQSGAGADYPRGPRG
jgi:DHA1 family arabinose polymer transporter-like MFS transporter